MTHNTIKTILAVVSIAVIMASCGDRKHPGFEKTESGVYYKIHTTKEGAKKSQVGDIITVNAVFKLGKSVFVDSKQLRESLRLEVTKPTYKGDIAEGYALLKVGDSATIITSADSFLLKTLRLPKVPDTIKPGTELSVEIKVLKIQTRAEFEAEKQALISKQIEGEKAFLAKYLEENKINSKPINGLYFMEVQAGKGAKISKGKKTTVNLIGSNLAGQKMFSTLDQKQPYQFELGSEHQLKMLDDCFEKMKVGGKYRVITEPKMVQQNGMTIPQTSVVFDVEVLSVQ